MTPILREINKEVEDFKSKQIQIVPGFYFNQYEVLQKNIFYFNSRFTTGPIDDEGDRKYFFNITRNPCKVFTKAIDFDTKNIRLLTTGGGDPLKTWFMERDLKYWMRDIQFGKVLNRIFKELPIYGSVVLKIVDGDIYFVDLRNFVVEQSADDLESSNYINEIHNMTVDYFRKVAKKMKWPEAKVKETIDEFQKMRGVSHIRIYERYGDVPKETSTGIEYEYRRLFFADVGVDEYDDRGQLAITHKGVELSSETWEGNPYWEFHKDKIPGRWLGVSTVEELYEPQIKHNEIANLQSKSAYWKALMLFQTRDQSFGRNLRSDFKNGDTIPSESEITQIDMSDRNLAFFNEETQKWMSNRDELTFSYDVVQGERTPAGTPLGSAKISLGQTLSYFEGVQEEIALDIKEMIYSVIIPQFAKESSQEHTLRLVGKDFDTYIDMVKNDLVTKELVRLAVKSQNTGSRFPTDEDKQTITMAVEASIRQGKEKLLTIPKGFYSNAKYDVDIDITGESVDTRVKYATLFAILQAITADPTMTTDPVKKKILYQMSEAGGINAGDLFDTSEQSMNPMMPGRAGGGVSAPQLANSLSGETTTTV